jgi:ring-1,2-phenylacetyl-CoA epoxidase subunit PaaB
MSDTQWPRYEVFKQDNPKKRHESVGTVHAPDAEMALLNARDVFVRRPSAVSIWVVPASHIFAITAEEMALNPDWHQETIASETTAQTFYIFAKQSQRRSMTYVEHVGEVVAQTAVQAIQQALNDNDPADGDVFVWWAVAQTAVTRSEDDDIASMFAPAKDKTYRLQTHYGFVDPLRKKKV